MTRLTDYVQMLRACADTIDHHGNQAINIAAWWHQLDAYPAGASDLTYVSGGGLSDPTGTTATSPRIVASPYRRLTVATRRLWTDTAHIATIATVGEPVAPPIGFDGPPRCDDLAHRTRRAATICEDLWTPDHAAAWAHGRRSWLEATVDNAHDVANTVRRVVRDGTAAAQADRDQAAANKGEGPCGNPVCVRVCVGTQADRLRPGPKQTSRSGIDRTDVLLCPACRIYAVRTDGELRPRGRHIA